MEEKTQDGLSRTPDVLPSGHGGAEAVPPPKKGLPHPIENCSEELNH